MKKAISTDKAPAAIGPYSQAIEVLSQLAGSERLVGIISHVTELKEQIEHRLYVTRTENGSEAVWECRCGSIGRAADL